jgi:SPP1 family predicted phage head-tail adaptor
MIRAGQLRTPVTFKSKSVIKNEYGEEVDVFTHALTTRCEVVNLQHTNGILAAGLEKESNITIKMRYSRALNPQLWFVINNQLYEIKSLENIGNRNKEITIDGLSYL